MRILVVGSGAREHAIIHALAGEADSGPGPHDLHAAPGNPGIAALATIHAIDPNDPQAVAALAARLAVDLVVVGPEAPLVAGVADAVRAAGIACFGPSAAAAQLEGSKAFAKDVMAAAGVPTALAHVCTDVGRVAAALDAFGPPYVVKDDGLAAGKGVVVTPDRAEALAHAAACLAKGAGCGEPHPGTPAVVVEEYLDGPEVSLFCISDGRTVVPLAPAQDFKRALDGDAGPNTGGMGAYSPLPWAPPDLVDDVVARVAIPTIREMSRRGIPFAGVLYVGLALTDRGPRVVEFNARFGDPETQVVLARLASPLSALLAAAARGELAEFPSLRWHPSAAVTVVVAAHGYPASPRLGDEVLGAPDAAALPGVTVLQAGTALVEARGAVEARGTEADPGPSAGVGDGPRLVSAGGRVLSVVGVGDDLAAARERAYAGVECIALAGSHYRRDIALGAAVAEAETAVIAGAARAAAEEQAEG